jgi:hypothetical protein
MPTYRIYYAERDPGTKTGAKIPSYTYGDDSPIQFGKEPLQETEWEEQVDAESSVEALDAFLRARVKDNRELAWVDDDGESHPVEGLDYNPDLTYIWVENGKLMEYQGFDEATPGMVTCPLCNGHGEVDEELAAEFEEAWGEEEEDTIDADVQG